MRVSRYERAAGAFGHVLLVVVLALGVFVMHTLGHPDGSSGHGTGTASHAAPVTSSVHDPMGAPASRELGHAEDCGHPTCPHEPAMAMDMMSLCMAVLLGVWVLAALLRTALSRRPGRSVDLLADAPVSPRPSPPPRGPDPIRLSVLRQ
ncbi:MULTISPECIES: DUF6153 family protein [unclassified Streptomyces]|uniref:DUF6153 family protein n=1 Tax=unclassified Streptomyces TaxID=2593676 RepID=UPI002258E977|nr:MULTISPECIES: DUF6153 family protein [unclassified Streptomyces]MCX4987812.1 DUF6153 family protein [Streptomyces sp. NBC_00568]MCX5007055.1 DUF6153 family protein [Streptomyces sp. NBC_00638]